MNDQDASGFMTEVGCKFTVRDSKLMMTDVRPTVRSYEVVQSSGDHVDFQGVHQGH
jgi:hypothetical protein